MSTQESPTDSRHTLVRMVAEYFFKATLMLTSCAIVLAAALVYLGILPSARQIDIKDLVIIAGLGFSAANASYFKPLRRTGN